MDDNKIKQLIHPYWRKNSSPWKVFRNIVALVLLIAFYYYLNKNY